jgi:group I intron endonuclease
MKKCGIYSIINKIDNKIYYGSTKDWKIRRKIHLNDLKNNTHGNIHLQRAYNRDGQENFIFKFELEVYEQYLLFIEQIYLNNNKNGYNIAINAQSAHKGLKHSLKTKIKMRKNHKGFKGRKHSNKTKEKMSMIKRGNFLPFEEAKKFVHSLKLSCQLEWFEYCKTNKNKGIPYDPRTVYKRENKWVHWGDWLGTYIDPIRNKNFLGFNEAKAKIKKMNIKCQREWFRYSKLGKLPKDIPSHPEREYKNNGWLGWKDWLNE